MVEFIQKYWVFGLGFFAQFIFGVRLIAQWIQSEREGRVVSPVSFWQISLVAALILLVYGILRDDFVIIIGQLLSHFIYIRNLQLKQAWNQMHIGFRLFAYIAPFVAVGWIALGPVHNFADILAGSDFTRPLVALGATGQIILSLRFVYQWYYSEKLKTSVLPFGFWVISLLGSLLVVIYAIFRKDIQGNWSPDPVLIFAQGLGVFVYIRNMIIHKRTADEF
jgi:lipid-A-disaccharide synthase-like uncharacterized protein